MIIFKIVHFSPEEPINHKIIQTYASLYNHDKLAPSLKENESH